MHRTHAERSKAAAEQAAAKLLVAQAEIRILRGQEVQLKAAGDVALTKLRTSEENRAKGVHKVSE